MADLRGAFGAAAMALLAACTGDEFTATGGGGGSDPGPGPTSGPTSTPSSADASASSSGAGAGGPGSSSASSGGGAPTCDLGCTDGDGTCHEERTPAFCGPDGGVCGPCNAPSDDCQEAVCSDGVCGQGAVDDDAPCDRGNGACLEGACIPTNENCLDGMDNRDEDELADCADRDSCAGFHCSRRSPQGFGPPALLIESEAPATCPDGLTQGTPLHGDPQGVCSCEEPGIDTCTATFEVEGTAACGGIAEGVVSVAQGCVSVTLTGDFGVETVVTVGTCSAEASVVDATTRQLTPCALNGGGCEGGQACLAPFDQPEGETYLLCVEAPSPTDDCPPDFSQRHPVSPDGDLGCACTCTVDDDTCGGELLTFSDPGCSECGARFEQCGEVPVPLSGCTPVQGGAAATFARVSILEPGEMNADPGPVRFTAPEAKLLCCRPYFQE